MHEIIKFENRKRAVKEARFGIHIWDHLGISKIFRYHCFWKASQGLIYATDFAKPSLAWWHVSLSNSWEKLHDAPKSANLLLDSLRRSGKRVVELGCGIGLPSLVCASMGARVLATDLPSALQDCSQIHNFKKCTPSTSRILKHVEALRKQSEIRDNTD